MSKTKVHIYGEDPKKKEGKPIEFVCHIRVDGTTGISYGKPRQWRNVMLMPTKIYDFDVIRAWDFEEENYTTYLSHWNDGFVEE